VGKQLGVLRFSALGGRKGCKESGKKTHQIPVSRDKKEVFAIDLTSLKEYFLGNRISGKEGR